MYAPAEVWSAIHRYPIADRGIVEPRRPLTVLGIGFEAFPVERDGRAIGHASIRAQLGWCAAGGVRRAVFTHCDSEIVKGDARTIAKAVRELGSDYGIEAVIAYDGLELSLT